MHVLVPSRDVTSALKTIRPAVPKGAAAARHARLEAIAGALYLTAMSVDLSVRTKVAADVLTAGSVVVHHPDLTRAVKGVKGTIAVAVDADEVVVGDDRVSVTTAAGTSLPEWQWTDPVPFDVDAFAAVLPAASDDITKPALTCVAVQGSTIVATDSYRLHAVTLPEAVHTEEVLLPAAALRAVVAAKPKAPTIQWSLHRRSEEIDKATWEVGGCRVVDGGTVWEMRTLFAPYPQWRLLIRRYTDAIAFPRPQLEQTMREFAKLSDYPTAWFEAGPLTVWTRPPATDPRLVSLPGHSPTVWGCNPVFLADLVHGLSTCMLQVIDEFTPAYICETDNAGRFHERLLMPHRPDSRPTRPDA